MEAEQLQELLKQMTLAEKVGQLVQTTPDFFGNSGEITGPMVQWSMDESQLYQIGSILGTHHGDQVRKIQEKYLANSRLQIPLLFMADVIHGYETIFPIPLALASSFDEGLIEKVAEASAAEAASQGIHVTFSPMADYVKDPRWGRVLESNGEDPRLSKALTESYVRGYQGQDLQSQEAHIAACVKHFVGYGAGEAGRDYNTVDFSEVSLHQNYLPAFRGAISTGVKMVMTAFNSYQGVPVSANQTLIQEVLREQLGFNGVLISDWAAIAELMAHRVATDAKEASEKAFKASVDIDMMTDCYLNQLGDVVSEQDLVEQLDTAVLRVLTLKNELGLFENPYRGLAVTANETELNELAYQAALKSAVLLKNEGMLPLQADETILLTGPLADSQDVLGAWSWIGEQQVATSLATGMNNIFDNVTTLPSNGDQERLDQVLQDASGVAKVVIVVGENSEQAGEAASRTNLSLKAEEIALIEAVQQVNPNIILVTFSGRPLVLTKQEPLVKGLVAAWFLGSRTGEALAALLNGRENFSAHLPMGFPRSVGQLPYSYQEMSTGRPQTAMNFNEKYISRYLDEVNGPLYPFGHGLSYSHFKYSEFHLSQTQFGKAEALIVECVITNDSATVGTDVPQLYFRDEVTEVIRPKIELLNWQRIVLQPFESQKVQFTVKATDLAYVHSDLTWRTDPGDFSIFLGQSASDLLFEAKVTYLD